MKILGNKQLLKPPASFITLLDYSKDDHVEYTVTSVQVGLLTIFVLVHLYTRGKCASVLEMIVSGFVYVVLLLCVLT